MGRALGFVGLLLAVAIGAYLYTHQGGTQAAPATKTTVDVIGVKNDLIAIANAERGQLALDGKYATLDELVQKGSLTMSRTSRPPYTYSAEINGGEGFRIVATYGGPPDTGAPQRISIDQTMQVTTE